MPRHCAFLFCCQFCRPQVIISRAFGEFGRHAARFLENEECIVKRERGLKDTLAKLHLEEIFWRRMRFLGTAVFVVLCIWGMTVLLFINLEQTLILNSESTAIFQSFLTGYTASGSLVLSFRIMFSAVVSEQTERDIKFGNGHDGSDIFLARALLASFRFQSSVWGPTWRQFLLRFRSYGLRGDFVWQIGVPYDESLPISEDHPWCFLVISWFFFHAALCICYLMYEFWQETALQLKECRDLRFPRDNGGLPDAEVQWQHLVDRSYQWSDQCC